MVPETKSTNWAKLLQDSPHFIYHPSTSRRMIEIEKHGEPSSLRRSSSSSSSDDDGLGMGLGDLLPVSSFLADVRPPGHGSRCMVGLVLMDDRSLSRLSDRLFHSRPTDHLIRSCFPMGEGR